MLIGDRLGPYDVLAKLGEGGMGEVYRALDTKLGREVALKILPEAFASDPDRLMRFEREARTLASLNHPHIAQVYGVEDSGATRALVMELVAGEDLSTRIARGPIPLDEALPIARQIAEALEAAHEAGIIHRDLKPANIKLRDDGTVKVLDFGLAKALDVTHNALGDGATITSPAMTMRGVILGTAAYMSPEQAKGKPVDRRADIWAFGCVLYEMLSGQRAFKGAHVTDTLTAVLRDEPDWAALPAKMQPILRMLLRRCLVKDTKERLRDIADARILLEEHGELMLGDVGPTRAPRAHTAAWLATALVLTGLTFAAARLSVPASPALPEARFEVSTPDSSDAASFAISPDGQRLAWTAGVPGQRRLWVRHMDATAVAVVPGSEGAVGPPRWSPSGRWIAFVRDDRTLMRIAVEGGGAEAIARGVFRGTGWISDAELVFADGDGRLQRVSAAGGPPQSLFPSDPNTSWPTVLPDGEHVLYYSRPSATVFSDGELRIESLATGTSKAIVRTDTMGAVAGHQLLFTRGSSLIAQSLDLERLELVGEPATVTSGVLVDTLTNRGAFDASASGTVVFRPAPADAERWSLRLLSRTGAALQTFAEAAQAVGPAVSPDGTRVAFHRLEQGGGDLWTLSLADAAQRRLTFDPTQENASPLWSPDGQKIVFRSHRGSNWLLVEKAANGVGADRVLAELPHPVSPMTWSPDGQHLVFTVDDPATKWDLWIYSFVDGQAKPLVRSPALESFAQFSPDGRWLAYNVIAPFPQLVVESFPTGRAKWQIGGGLYPRWRPAGRELLFLSGDSRGAPGHSTFGVSAVDVRVVGDGLEFGGPRRLFDASAVTGPLEGYVGNFMPWAVSPDGQRVLLQQSDDADRQGRAAPPLVVIMNHAALRPRP